MNLAFIGKILGGIFLTGGTSIAAGYLLVAINYENEGTETKNIYAISQQISNNNDSNTKLEKETYGCKIGSKYYQCEIKAAQDFDKTKKWIDLSGLKTDKSEDITASSLKVGKNIYKIIIKNDVDLTANEGQIEIIKKAWYEGEKYAKLKALFFWDSSQSDVDAQTKTKYFIVKTGATATSGLTADKTYKCLTSSTTIVATENATEDCNVYDFSSETSQTDLKSLNFKKIDSSSNTTISANKYYLVVLKEAKTKEQAKHIQIQQNTTKITLDNTTIIQAALENEQSENIFILKSLSTSK